MECLGLELCCKRCGGTNVQHVGWYYPNRCRLIDKQRYYRDGGEFGDWNSDPCMGRTYCADCDQEGATHPELCDGPRIKEGEEDDPKCLECPREKKCAWFDPEMRGGVE